jgi:hypothetical protein
MARLTIKQLSADLEASHVAYQALEAKYEGLKAELAQRAVKRINAPEHQRDVVLSSYRQTLMKARALAMSTGRVVAVSSVN